MSFETAVARVLDHEKGYVNNPKDPGGETNWGITVGVARSFGYTGNMRELPVELAKTIYKQLYWDKCRCGQMGDAIAFQVMDAAVNHGCGRSVKFLQQAVGTTVDGLVGPKTIAAASAIDPLELCNGFLDIRMAFYKSLPTFTTFGRGWSARVDGNRKFAQQDCK